MATEQGTTGETDGDDPGFLLPGIRCALEMVLAGGLVLLVGLPADNVVFFGLVVTLALVVMVVVLFWALNRQMQQWVDHALQEEPQGSTTQILGEDSRSD